MSSCSYKACPYQAVMGKTLCLHHEPKPIAQDPNGDVIIVTIGDIPKGSRHNAAALHLVDLIKQLTEGKAAKIKLAKIPKPTILTAQRYALEGGIRIGVRFAGDFGFMWKYSDEEIKLADAKGQRLKAGREKTIGKTKIAAVR